MRCKGPVNRLVMMRSAGFYGPFLQSIGGGACVHTAHFNATGARAIRGEVSEALGPVSIFFSAPVSVPCLTGIVITLDGAPVTGLSVAKVSDTQFDFTFDQEVIAGDIIVWAYAGGNDCILDQKADDIGDQSVNVVNNVVMAGAFVLLETGGRDTLLTEDNLDVALEDAVV